MPVYTIGILVGLMVLGALIAWAGDVIGYRLGKSRSSIWGLRPRTTARLVGVLVGAVLPLVGLVAAALISPMARVALLQLDQLTQEQRTLRQDNDLLHTTAQQLRRKVGTLRRQAQQAEERSVILEGRVDELDSYSQRLQRDVAGLTATRNRLHSRVAHLEKEHRKAQQELAGARTELAAAKKELTATRDELRSADAEVKHLLDRNQELEAKEATLKETVAKLQDEIPQLEKQVNTLGTEVGKATQQLAETKEKMAELQNGLEVLRNIRDLRQREADYWEQQYDLLRKRYAGIAQSPVVYEAGDVLLRAIVRTDQTEEQLSNTLMEMLPFAGLAAERKGAVRGENGRATLLVAPWPPGITDRDPTESDIVEYLAGEMKRLRAVDQFVVSVLAFRRFVAAERDQVHVAMWPMPNVRVFVKDEVIAETVIKGDSKASDIFTSLWYLLRHDVRQEAQRRGLLPNPETGQYGGIDAGELFTMIEEIEAYNYDVRVQVVPAQDAYTADELKIKFAIHRESAAKSNE